MITKLIRYSLSSMSIGFGLIFIIMNPVCASEVSDSEMDISSNVDGISPVQENDEKQDLTVSEWNDTLLSSAPIEVSLQDEIDWTAMANNTEFDSSLFQNGMNIVVNAETIDLEISQWQPDTVASLNPLPELSSESKVSAAVIEPIESETEPLFSTFSTSELAQLSSKNWQASSVATESASNSSESSAELPSESNSETEASTSTPWRFTFVPYAFAPLTTTGSVTVRDFTADIDLGLDDILDPLNFALAGRLEAWHGNLGVIFDGAYFSIGQDNSISRDCRGCFAGILPSRIDTEVNVQYGQFDLGVGYRIAGVNPATAATDFDLGPLVLDTIIGVRIYTIHQEINLSTNLGTDRNFDNSNTLIQPLVSSRLRWNVSPKLAGWVRGDVAGFGIGGTLMAFSVTGGVDWMFSGDTSLLLAYRLSSLQYDTEVGGQDFDMDLVFQGPYMGVVFRF